jgi:hypothetical protein
MSTTLGQWMVLELDELEVLEIRIMDGRFSGVPGDCSPDQGQRRAEAFAGEEEEEEGVYDLLTSF